LRRAWNVGTGGAGFYVDEEKLGFGTSAMGAVLFGLTAILNMEKGEIRWNI